MDGIASVDQLPVNADPVADFAHAAFEHIAYAKFAGDLLHIDIFTFVRKTGISRDDEEPLIRDSAVMMSSTVPSAKYSCSGSPLRLLNGSTAMDGLSGMARERAGSVCFSVACTAPATAVELPLTYIADELKPFAGNSAEQALIFGAIPDGVTNGGNSAGKRGL